MPGPVPILTEGGFDLEAESGSNLLTEGTPNPPVVSTIGTQSDILSRLQQLLPRGWFAVGASPIKDALLAGAANILAYIYSTFSYLRFQTRIATATDGFLDLIAQDFFGSQLPRTLLQSDPSYRARIQANLFLERATRHAIIQILVRLTGRTPIVFEPMRPADCGAYNNGVLAYGLAGGYGSMSYPYQAFVTAFRPHGSGIVNVAGYGNPEGAYNTASQIEYISQAMIGGLQDGDIYAAVDSVHVFGTIIWVAISS